ncbi:MAG: hypothetical protein ABFC94_19070 [Syntrophomonas sp.]
MLIPIAVVFLSFYLSRKFDESKRDIGQSNIATIDEIENIKRDIEDIRNSIFSKLTIDVEIKKPEPTEEEIRDKNKEKVHKFISISMFAHTADVAEHLGISKEEAFSILKELVQYDHKISAGGQLTEANMDNVIWLKK